MLLCEWLLLYCCYGGGSAAELAAADRGPLQTQLTGRFKLGCSGAAAADVIERSDVDDGACGM